MRNDEFSEGTKLPTHAVMGSIGKVRIKDYAGHGYFNVIDVKDTKRFVHRRNLTFLKG